MVKKYFWFVFVIILSAACHNHFLKKNHLPLSEQKIKTLLKEFITDNQNRDSLKKSRFNFSLDFMKEPIVNQKKYYSLGIWRIEQESNKIKIYQSYSFAEEITFVLEIFIVEENENFYVQNWKILDLYQ
ncbi:MAG: hypothetical protein OEZ13_12490 [Spirochaetia bacterium]|nr:hypothetical protein [Spirochaetia bacterium]